MARDLPWFKFSISEWTDGDITLCSISAQGLFINLCANYWSLEGDLSLAKAKRRYSESENLFAELVDEGVIKVQEDDKIVISFLDKQFLERGVVSKTNSQNAKEGWKKRTKDAIRVQPQSEPNAIACNIEESRREQSRAEQKIPVDLFDIDFNLFWNKYDKKTDKPLCQKKWDNLTPETKKKILAHLDAYIPATPDKAFRKNPLTYLRNFAWENEVIPIQNAKKTDKKESATDFLKRVKETV